jgi:glycerol-3-phosphate dehydrogenase
VKKHRSNSQYFKGKTLQSKIFNQLNIKKVKSTKIILKKINKKKAKSWKKKKENFGKRKKKTGEIWKKQRWKKK